MMIITRIRIKIENGEEIEVEAEVRGIPEEIETVTEVEEMIDLTNIEISIPVEMKEVHRKKKKKEGNLHLRRKKRILSFVSRRNFTRSKSLQKPKLRFKKN